MKPFKAKMRVRNVSFTNVKGRLKLTMMADGGGHLEHIVLEFNEAQIAMLTRDMTDFICEKFRKTTPGAL